MRGGLIALKSETIGGNVVSKKIYPTLILIFFVSIFCAFLIPCASATEKSKVRLRKSFPQKAQTSYQKKLREFIDLQKDFGNPSQAIKTVDLLLNKIKKKIKPKQKYSKREAVRTLQKIAGFLKEEGNFAYGKNNLLIEALGESEGKRFIDCDGFSSLYLAAGENLGLSLNPVYVPSHIFIRCKINSNTFFYWEPTLAAEKDLNYYKSWLKIKEESEYPLELDEEKFRAIQLCNLGAAWYKKGDFKKAIAYSNAALRLHPHYAEAYNNLGAANARLGNLSLALECYGKAIAINPRYAAAYSNMGIAYYKMGKFDEALGFFKEATKADSRYRKAYFYEYIVLKKKGEVKQALKTAARIRKHGKR